MHGLFTGEKVDRSLWRGVLARLVTTDQEDLTHMNFLPTLNDLLLLALVLPALLGLAKLAYGGAVG